MGSEDFIRMNIGYVNGQYIANPLTRGAGVTMSLVRADGLLVVPSNSLGYEQGEEVEVELYKPVEQIKQSILFSGSHDLSVDVLSSLIKEQDVSQQVISSHTGSMAGIMAIRKGEAHVAGIHLLQSESGEYNIPYLKQYLKNVPVVLLKFLQREQGWIVPKGNPKQVQSINDMIEKEILYVNRQRGAGTRLLFDYLLKEATIEPDKIEGYNREMYSHLSVAAAVKSGSADAGLGVYAAANALQLDFVPVSYESYDLVMSQEFYESKQGQTIVETIQSQAFRNQLEVLGGYKMEETGKAIYL
ncbi:substrate-binding domain-containing protein [Desertibacillus haloalkaliphilus]|uniref:substrate-binding domain-containing protein n=1 Tax=Desertibacillus haloalkaliphilus TaxID=1328930 RepID=UPI0028ADF1BB|nr:substrate-binding domain-containing protein [Desertibacillus haloalkaliphilus]